MSSPASPRDRTVPSGPAELPPGPLARAMLAWRDRYAAWARRHPLVIDSALVALLVLLSHPILSGPHADALRRAWYPVLIAGLLLPLAWRRRAPFAVFAVIAAAAFAQWLFFRPFASDLAPLIAFYTVAAYEPARRILVAAGMLEVGAVLAAIRFGQPHDGIFAWAFITALVTAAGVIGYYVRTRRAYLAAQADRAIRLERERDQQAELAAAAERARIAREMHDIVAHNIAVMIALADGAAYTAADQPDQAVTIMGQVSATGRTALTEMRRLLGVMRQPPAPDGDPARTGTSPPGLAPQPALADLDDLLAGVRAAGVAVTLSESGNRADLPLGAQLAVYRIVQESLTNTLKHVGPASARARITCGPQQAEVEVIDDGGGPDREAGGPGAGVAGTAPGPGHGIAGMAERAAVFGGTLTAGPLPGGGWRVHAVLRLGAARPESVPAVIREGA